jgi:multiple sugar transport system permease protein
MQSTMKRPGKNYLAEAATYGTLIVLAIIIVTPIVWVIINSLKTDLELTTYPLQVLPREFHFQNYIDALTLVPYGQFALNSLFLATLSSVLIVFSSSLVGFGFARFAAPGRGALFFIVVSMLLVPPIVTVIPQFMIYAELELTNTYWPWVFGGLAGSPFFIFLFRQFFATFPRELEEAAEVDGCSFFGTYWRIFLPNAKPALAVAFVLNFSGVWGDWYMPLIYLQGDKTTLAVKMATSYVNPQGQALETVSIAGAILFALPLAFLFFVIQRYIMQGVISSGLKG